ncbi:hypothetical protein HG530_006610 [Fusarium avenaceum]|nr:hypothetical protein HG530_006610 [Fusarium avenaceum]
MASLLQEKILSKPQNPQTQCPLFCTLPAEVRDEIFSYVLTDHPDPNPTKQFKETTCYTRPSYLAHQLTDTRLLRTCRAIYRETWFKPYVLREHTRWASSGDRAPPRGMGMATGRRLVQTLKRIAKQLGQENVEIERLRVFAQMYKLDEGDLATILRTPYLAPRAVTLTIRHTDWWFWEDDDPLVFHGKWLTDVGMAMTASTNVFRIELESLERKKDQVNKIADQMAKEWFIKRSDGVVLYADVSGKSRKVDRWSGSSIWHGRRWIRDETEPNRLDYYILTVTFRPQHEIERSGGTISETAFKSAQRQVHFFSELRIPGQDKIEDPKPFVYDENDSEDDQVFYADLLLSR